jgi:hypothetical protein
MNRIKTAAVSTKNHIESHKGTYAMGLVAIGAIVLQQRNLNEFFKFLEEKGIDPLEFSNPEYYEELNS